MVVMFTRVIMVIISAMITSMPSVMASLGICHHCDKHQ
jgi:hypothetical protein